MTRSGEEEGVRNGVSGRASDLEEIEVLDTSCADKKSYWEDELVVRAWPERSSSEFVSRFNAFMHNHLCRSSSLVTKPLRASETRSNMPG